MSTVLLGLLDHVSRDRQLKQQHGCELSSCLLGQWSQLRSWWEGQQSELRPNAINLLRKVLSIEQKVSTSIVCLTTGDINFDSVCVCVAFVGPQSIRFILSMWYGLSKSSLPGTMNAQWRDCVLEYKLCILPIRMSC